MKYTIKRNNKVKNGKLTLISMFVGLFVALVMAGCKDPVDPVDPKPVRTGVDKTLFEAGYYGSPAGFDRGIRSVILSKFPDGAYPTTMTVELTAINDFYGIFKDASEVRKDSILLAIAVAAEKMTPQTASAGEVYWYAEIPAQYQKFFPNTKGKGGALEEPWAIGIAQPIPGFEVTGLILGNGASASSTNKYTSPTAFIYGK